MSERTRIAIEARERRSRGEPDEVSYRELQDHAKRLGIPAKGSKDELAAAIDAKLKEGLDGAEGES